MQKRYWIIIILTVLIAVWGAGKYIAFQRVKSLIEEANANGNELSVSSFSVKFQLLALGVTAEDIQLKQQVGNRVITGKIKHLNLSGLRLVGLLLKRTPTAGSLVIDGPDLIISDSVVARLDSAQNSSPEQSLLQFKEMHITNGNVKKVRSSDQKRIVKFSGINLSVDEFLLPLAPKFIESVDLSIDSIQAPNDKTASDWLITNLKHSPNKEVFSIEQVTKTPRSTAKNYLTSITYKKEWMAIRLDSISIGNFPLDELLKGEPAMMSKLNIQDLNIAVYENPSLERDPTEPGKPMPVEDFRRLGMPFTIDQLEVNRCQIQYGAIGDAGRKAQLKLEDGTIEVRNLSTIEGSDSARIKTNFKFNGATPLSVDFVLDQSGTGRNFRAWGEMDSYSLVDLNPLMLIAADVFLEAGQIDKMDFNTEVKEDISRGKMLFTYHDLDIKIEGKNAWLKNLAQGLIVQDRNPRKDGELRMGSIYHEHPGDRSFFNLFWKSVVSGMQSTVAGNLVNSKELDSEVVE